MMQSATPRQEEVTELPYALKVFLLLSVGLTIISFVYTIICRQMNLGLPYSCPYWYAPGSVFSDFFQFHDLIREWGTPLFFDHTSGHSYFLYPAPLVHVFRFFFSLPHPRTWYLLTILGASGSLALAFVRVLRRQGLATRQSILFVCATALLSYPLCFDLELGNVEFLIWLLTTMGVWGFFSGRTTQSAIFLGLAASLKPTPFIFFGLFPPRRKYGGVLLGLGIIAVVTLLSLYAIGPTIAAAARWNREQLAVLSKEFVGKVAFVGYDHSFFGLLKVLTVRWHPNYFAWVRPYDVTVAVLSVALYFLRIWHLPLPNQILALSALCVSIAPVSYDYTLLSLYPAFAMLVVLALQAQRRGRRVPHLTMYMVLFALIFTPQSYVIYHGSRYEGQPRAICLIVMLVLALMTPLPEAESSHGDQP